MVRRDASEYLGNFDLTIPDEKQENTCFLELISIKLWSGGGDTSESRKENTVCVG